MKMLRRRRLILWLLTSAATAASEECSTSFIFRISFQMHCDKCIRLWVLALLLKRPQSKMQKSLLAGSLIHALQFSYLNSKWIRRILRPSAPSASFQIKGKCIDDREKTKKKMSVFKLCVCPFQPHFYTGIVCTVQALRATSIKVTH